MKNIPHVPVGCNLQKLVRRCPMVQQTKQPPGASEFKRFVDHVHTHKVLPDMSINGNMGVFHNVTIELIEAFTNFGFDGFGRALEVAQRVDANVNTVLSTPPEDEPVGILLSDVKPEAIHWLWPGWMALRKLHTVDG